MRLSPDFFGSILSVLWTLYVTVGFISQVLKNRKERRFGWSRTLFFLAYVTYVFGVLYGASSKDIYILIPYVVGFVFLNVLLCQFLRYKWTREKTA